jgi:hypothetical protein
VDAWIDRLKAAYDAGYYRTEAARGEQTPFPWQNKSCKDCPFWANSICQVFSEYRSAMAHTCVYFDPWNRETAQHMIQERQEEGFRRWWEWFNDRGSRANP